MQLKEFHFNTIVFFEEYGVKNTVTVNGDRYLKFLCDYAIPLIITTSKL